MHRLPHDKNKSHLDSAAKVAPVRIVRCAIKARIIARPASLAPVQAPAALRHQNAKHPLHMHVNVRSHFSARILKAMGKQSMTSPCAV